MINKTHFYNSVKSLDNYKTEETFLETNVLKQSLLYAFIHIFLPEVVMVPWAWLKIE